MKKDIKFLGTFYGLDMFGNDMVEKCFEYQKSMIEYLEKELLEARLEIYDKKDKPLLKRIFRK